MFFGLQTTKKSKQILINYYEIIINRIQSFNANNVGYRYLRIIIKYWHMLTPTIYTIAILLELHIFIYTCISQKIKSTIYNLLV